MFKAVIADAREWRNILAAISPLIEEGSFRATEAGLSLRSMDTSHAAMVDFEWKQSGFSSYTCSEPVMIRIQIGDMIKKLHGAGSDPLELSYDQAAKRLNVVLKGKWRTTFTLPILDAEDNETPLPKVVFDSRVLMSSSGFKDMVEQLQTVSDSARFESTSDKFVAEGNNDFSSVRIEVDKTSAALAAFEIKAPSKATYNLRYLAEIAKSGATASENVVIEFSTNVPIKVEYEVPQRGRITYYLAPRVES